MQVTERLLELVYDSTVPISLVQSALEVISAVLSTASPTVLLTFGSYLVYSLPTTLENEHRLQVRFYSPNWRGIALHGKFPRLLSQLWPMGRDKQRMLHSAPPPPPNTMNRVSDHLTI